MDKYSSEEILNIIKEDAGVIKLVSFDIFDTLIFRCVDEPDQIFALVGSRAKDSGMIPSHLTNLEFRYLRVAAEKKARKTKEKHYGHIEVTLEEIYDVISDMIKTKSLLELEVDIEAEQCYANHEIKRVIEQLYIEGKKIILTSDMYLSRKQVEKILIASGYKLKWFDDIFMSSEYKASKHNGELYKVVLDKYGLRAEEVIHIGDNYSSDVLRASFLGMKTYHYDIVTDKNNMILEMEKLAFGSLVPQVASIRKMLGKTCKQYNEEENIWYQIGTTVMGPILTGYAEWIIEVAQKNNIKKIFPLMREGKLISFLVAAIIKERNLEIEVEPMYISRKAIFLPSMNEWNIEKLDEIIEISQISIKSLFELLKIDMPENWELEYGKYTVKEARKLIVGSVSLDKMLKEYLLTDSSIQKINENIEKETELAYSYLMKLSKGEPFLTADLGFKGTIPIYIERLLKKKGIYPNNIHLLLFGSFESVDTFLEGVDIRGFLGNFGRNGDYIKKIKFSPYIFEELMMGDEGTTIGYKSVNDEIIPIKKDILCKNQIEKIAIYEKGIKDFEYKYFELLKEKDNIKLGIKDSDDLVKIAYRLHQYPTALEAKVISTLQHDVMGIDDLILMCRKEHIELIKQIGPEEFEKKVSIYDVSWRSGLLAAYDPMYFYKTLFKDGMSEYEAKIIDIIQRIINDKIESVVIIGAGEAGQKVKKYLDLYKYVGKKVEIEAFIDNNKNLQGNFIDGIKVSAMSESFDSECYIIGSFAYTEELLQQLHRLKGDEIKVYYSLSEIKN